MKRLVFMAILMFCFHLTSSAQSETSKPTVGDVLVVNAPSGTTYDHVFFPKLNFLAKRGKVANYKSIFGAKVVVKEVTDNNGNTYVTLERKNGKKFFGYLSKVKANYTKSLNSGELSRT